MRSRFIIVVEGITPVTRNAITAEIKKQGVSWWHWLQSTWLVSDPQGRPSGWWRDRTKAIAPKADILVIKVPEEGGWAGSGRPKMFDWLKTRWRTPKPTS